MAATLHEVTGIPGAFEGDVVGATMAQLIAHPDGLVLIAGDTGFLAAEVARTTISRQLVAMEHGWFSSAGMGAALLEEYEAWAMSKGCTFIRLSSPPRAERLGLMLARAGFVAAEQTWVKAV